MRSSRSSNWLTMRLWRLRLTVGCYERIRLGRGSVLRVADVQPLQASRTLIERDLDRGACALDVEFVGEPEPFHEAFVVERQRDGIARRCHIGFHRDCAGCELDWVGLAAIESPARG